MYITNATVVNPLLLSSLLNSSNSINVGCWAQNPLGEPQLIPVIYKNCREAITSIPMGGKALAPVTFGRSADSGFKVPQSWDYGGCGVGIDVKTEDSVETTTFAAILKRAFDIAVECVIKPPHFGGRSFIGEKELLTVFVMESGAAISPQ
ncbi:hypothetical protein MMC28_003329 [Mycoblastus sanguinarius]|nr:hypothetical protein [Mycoblastus sanguinarius]